MPFKLSGLKLTRVDLCPDGSNPDAHIVLFKSKEGHMPAPKKKVPAKKAKAPVKPQSKSKKKLEDDDEEEEEEDDVIAKADDDDDEEDDEEEDEEEVDEDEEEDETIAKGGRRKEDEDDDEDDKKKKKRGKKPAKKVKKAATDDDEEEVDDDDEDDEDLDDEDEIVGDEVMKTLPKHVRLLVAKQNDRLKRISKQAREASEMATVEKDRRESLEFVEKAKKDIPNLTGTDEEKGEFLKALFSGKPLETKVAKAIVKLLKAGDAAVKNLLMSETGSRRARTDDEDDAISQLREKAEAVQKADPKLTKEQAFEKACQQNQALYSQYRVEKRRARHEEN